MLSFLDNPGLKNSLLDNARSFQESKLWTSRPLHWDEESGSLVGGLLGSKDLDQWTREFALPKWLAFLVDMVAATASSEENGKASQIALLAAVPVGVDLNCYGNRILIRFLEVIRRDVSDFPLGNSMLDSLDGVMALHEAELMGNMPAPSLWKKARVYAISVTDQAENNDLEAKCGAVIEAAAWSPQSSRSSISDTFRSWINARGEIALERHVVEFGLLNSEGIKSLLREIYLEQKEKNKNSEEFINVFDVLEKQFPDKHKKLIAFEKIQREEGVKQREDAMDILVSVLESKMT